MRDPFIAVDSGTDLPTRARELRRSWALARSRGAAGHVDGVRPVIEASWRRTELAGLDPDRPAPRRAFVPDELGDRRDASPLRLCIETLRGCLGEVANDAEHVMVVVDASSRILWLEGDLRVRRQADRITFAEGMDWTEESVGTNAIGTALAIDHAVQVFSAEHFATGQHPWWCSAAPIHDPLTGAPIGAVDLSGPMRTAHPHSLALVAAAARAAEGVLRARQDRADERVRHAYLQRTIGAGRRARGLVSADGRVLVAEDAGLALARRLVVDGPGSVALPDGSRAEAEALTGGSGAHVLWATEPGRARRAPAALRVELLGAGAPTLQLGDGAPTPLVARHADLVCALLTRPGGLAGEDLSRLVFGPDASPVTVRAELSRLRRVLGDRLGARPYRLLGAVSSDVMELRAALDRGDAEAVVAAHRGPLLPDSHAPHVEQLRDGLEATVRRLVVRGELDVLWRWLCAPHARDDAEALAAFVRRAGDADARRPVAAARLRALQLG